MQGLAWGRAIHGDPGCKSCPCLLLVVQQDPVKKGNFCIHASKKRYREGTHTARGGVEVLFPGGSRPPLGEEIPREGPHRLNISRLLGDFAVRIKMDTGGGFLSGDALSLGIL